MFGGVYFGQTYFGQAFGEIVSEINTSSSVTVTEAVQRFLSISRSVSDSTSLTENVRIALVHNIAVIDTATITEAITAFIPTLNISVSDSSTISEAIKMSLEIGVIVQPGIQQINGVKIVG